MSMSELSRMVKPRALPAGPLIIEANEAERAALARRFGVTSILSLKAEVAFATKDNATLVNGHLNATIKQPCAVSRENFVYDIAEDFELHFVSARQISDYTPDEEFELRLEDLDEIEYDGDIFDMGEAIAQTLGLAIDPYREGPDADHMRAKAGITNDEVSVPSGPLAEALSRLRK